MASHCWILDVDDPASLENVVARRIGTRTDVPVFCGNSRFSA
jgi:hypothetical protein